MGIEIESLKGITGEWNSGRPCDSCKSAAASAFCKVESSFFCLSCDSKHHKLMVNPRHERVWLCEVCEQAPAAVTCKADAAALCVACDADIHSANPLARRHERVPIEPFFDSEAELIAKSTSSSPFGFLVPTENDRSSGYTDDYDELFTGPPMPPPVVNSKPINFGNSPFGEMKSGDPLMFVPEMDPGTLLDFEYKKLTAIGAGNDSVVPVQIKPEGVPISCQEINSFDVDFSRSKLSPLSYVSPQSISHSVSSSSVDVGVVPDGSSVSEISYPFLQNMKPSGSDVVSNGATLSSSATSGLDREARVLRYREKRKNRKFEKTIRYASRKAYAETRPRIKGRFAKRAETVPDLGQDHHRAFSPPSSTFSFVGAETQYGVVPIF